MSRHIRPLVQRLVCACLRVWKSTVRVVQCDADLARSYAQNLRRIRPGARTCSASKVVLRTPKQTALHLQQTSVIVQAICGEERNNAHRDHNIYRKHNKNTNSTMFKIILVNLEEGDTTPMKKTIRNHCYRSLQPSDYSPVQKKFDNGTDLTFNHHSSDSHCYIMLV
ncbi:hypothetical protein PHET_02893 [Paragonimus heterotremus]|uniref:Uncharacterized protein n=1 Tax=Paragonimus heterotremus TaxID=100268 RepID=A0A8J4T0V4_9TREM|nr:hypothetical protein PHET_02893 [Paragonimus heterotremus]